MRLPNHIKGVFLIVPTRRGQLVLQKALPRKEEYVLFVRMSPIQRTLYKEFMNTLKDEALSWANSNNPIKAFSVCCKVFLLIHSRIVFK